MKTILACLATLVLVTGCNTPNGSTNASPPAPQQASGNVIRGGTGADGSTGAGAPTTNTTSSSINTPGRRAETAGATR